MEVNLCVICLKGVGKGSTRRSSAQSTSRPELVTLCQLLTPPGSGGNETIFPEQDGGNPIALCLRCTELIEEMSGIQQQIVQLQDQIGKRIDLVRKWILGSDGNVEDRDLGDKTEGLRSIREVLLRVSGSGQDVNFISTPVDVKIENEEDFEDELLEDSCSPSLWNTVKDDMTLKNEKDFGADEGGDSESSFCINPEKQERRILRRSTRVGNYDKTEADTMRSKNRKRSSVPKSELKCGRKSGIFAKKKKLSRIKCTTSESETESDNPVSQEYDPIAAIDQDMEDSEETKPKSKFLKPLKCSYCAMRFSTNEELTSHVEQYHPEKCQYCVKRFPNETRLFAHHQASHNNQPFRQCPICKKKFNRKQWLADHMAIRHETEDKTFFCSKCNKGFTLEWNLTRHLDLHEIEDKKPLVCEICDSRFSDQARLARHLKTHNKKTYICQVCSQVCSNSGSLLRHRRIHTGEKPFKCDHCDERFIDHARKKYHIGKMHANPDEHHLCPVCGRRFFDNNNLKLHIARHEGKLNVTCDKCGEGFKYNECLKTHKIEKHGDDPIICDQCPATFKTDKGLALHKLSIHTGERPHKCDICDARFGRHDILIQHMTTHTQKRAYPCPHCEAKFKSRKNLSTHVLKIHTAGYQPPTPHECSYPGCGRKFEYKGALEGHVRLVHTLERPFVCEICEKGFAVQSTLNLHKKASHGVSVNLRRGNGERLPRSKRQFPPGTASKKVKCRFEPETSSDTTEGSSEPTNATGKFIAETSTIPNSTSFYNPSFQIHSQQ